MTFLDGKDFKKLFENIIVIIIIVSIIIIFTAYLFPLLELQKCFEFLVHFGFCIERSSDARRDEQGRGTPWASRCASFNIKTCRMVCLSAKASQNHYSVAESPPLLLCWRYIPFIIAFIVSVRSFENIATPTPKLRQSLMMVFMSWMRMYRYDNLG